MITSRNSWADRVFHTFTLSRKEMASRNVILLAFATRSLAQSIQGLGVSGGNGPRGGIGDVNNPVLYAQSWITDALIPITPNSTRELARGTAPVLSTVNGTDPTCAERTTVVIDAAPKGAQQEMVGFGHAWTDSTVSVFNELEPDVLNQVLDDLFGQDGNNM